MIKQKCHILSLYNQSAKECNWTFLTFERNQMIKGEYKERNNVGKGPHCKQIIIYLKKTVQSGTSCKYTGFLYLSKIVPVESN